MNAQRRGLPPPVSRPEAGWPSFHSVPQTTTTTTHQTSSSSSQAASRVGSGQWPKKAGWPSADWTRARQRHRGTRDETTEGGRKSRRARGGVPRRGGRAAGGKCCRTQQPPGAPATRVPSIIPCCPALCSARSRLACYVRLRRSSSGRKCGGAENRRRQGNTSRAATAAIRFRWPPHARASTVGVRTRAGWAGPSEWARWPPARLTGPFIHYLRFSVVFWFH